MPTITRLVAKKSGKSVKVYVDEEYALTLSSNEVYENNLDKGREISPKKLGILKQRENYEKYYLRALNLLSYRPRSIQEITNYLSQHLVSEKTTKKILSKLSSQNYLDDHDFAIQFTQSKINQLKGPILIKAKLYAKGINRQMADNAIRELLPDEQSLTELAKKSLEKKLRILKSLPPNQYKAKAYQHLQRQGFSYQTITSILSSLID